MAGASPARLTGNGTCGEDDCPNVYRTASGSIVVQGDVSDTFTPRRGKGSWRSPRAFFGRLSVLSDGDEWGVTLRGFQSEAWRLETLPQYLVPQEAEELEAFRAGKRADPHAYSSAYTEDLKRLRSEGKTVDAVGERVSGVLRHAPVLVLGDSAPRAVMTEADSHRVRPPPARRTRVRQ